MEELVTARDRVDRKKAMVSISKPTCPMARRDQEVEPHGPRQQQEGQGDEQRGVLPLADGELQAAEHLEHRQQHQPQPGGHGPAGLPPAAGLLLRGQGEEHGLHAPQAQHVAVLHRGLPLHRPAVHRHAALGAQIVSRPGVVLPADQGGVLPGDHRVVEGHVAALPPAQDVLPVGQGLLSPLGRVR